MPVANVLSAMPESVPSVLSFMAARYRIIDMHTPAASAASSPATQLFVKWLTSAPVTAETDMDPSMLMLSRRTLLEMSAANEAKTMGNAAVMQESRKFSEKIYSNRPSPFSVCSSQL